MRRWFPLLIVGAVLAMAIPASAQSELDQARANAERAAKESDEAREAADEARARADAIVGELDAAEEMVHQIETEQAAVAGRADRARVERDSLRDGVADLLVLRYVYIDRGDWIDEGGPSDQVRANALAQFASVGIGDDIDRYRVVTDDLAAADEELVELKVRQEVAIADLEAKDAQLSAEIDEMVRLLTLAEEREADFEREVGRLEEAERLRLEAERKAAAEARRLAREAAQREAAAELAKQRAEEAARAAQTSTTVAPTTAPPATASPSTGDGATETPGTTDPASPATVPPTAAPTTVPAPPPPSNQGFLCPIGGPTSFFDTWGAARSGGRSHKGVDMFAQRGTPVVAPVSGVVRHSSSSRLAGLAFYLNGDDGNVYFGAHLDAFGSSGRVAAGTVVGTVGNTGNARFSSPHLHFEIKPGGGSSINPTPTVRAACG